MKAKTLASLGFLWLSGFSSYGQTLYLEEALQRGIINYDKLKAKKSIIYAAGGNTQFQKQQYLPDVTLGAQQSYGTVNMVNGPMYAQGGLAAASTSMPLAEQNWNAAFGSLYFANINWNVYTFGRVKNQVRLGAVQEERAQADLKEEIFQHEVRVSAAYLNLLASQRIVYVQERNHDRASVFYAMTDARAKSGLIPEVDASLAKAEVSSAKSLWIKSQDKVFDYSKSLAVLLNEDFQAYQLDSLYSTSIPFRKAEVTKEHTNLHPWLALQQSQIDESTQAEALLSSHKRPTVSAFGVVQGRGTGFDWNYVQDNSAYSGSYLKGVGIDRSNYLLGVSLSWNITNLYRFKSRVKEQQHKSQSLRYQYDMGRKELDNQVKMADAQLHNAYVNFDETKTQLTAASLAYKQHTALYENGLTTLVDYTQALYSLNRAEIDYEIAQNNVWQALLLLASAKGDISLFSKAVGSKVVTKY